MVNGRLFALAVSLLIGGACTSSPVASVPSTPATLQSVTLGANLAAMTGAGQTTQATATGVFSDGTSKDLTATCTNWQSDNASVVTVNSTGMLTARGGGSAVITTTCQGVAARAVITITIRPASPPVASTFSLSGTITDGFSHGVLPNIYVQITDGVNHGRYTRTDAAGNYRLEDLTAGTLTLTISAVSYITTTQSVVLSADTRLDVVLSRAARPTLSSGLYRLEIDAQFTYGAPFCAPPPDPNGVMLFDGQLAVDKQSLRFTLPPSGSSFIPNDLLLQLTLAGATGSGTILSTSSFATIPALTFLGGRPLSVLIFDSPWSGSPAAVSANVDLDAHVTGMFQGWVRIDYLNPVYQCTGPFLWSLTPR